MNLDHDSNDVREEDPEIIRVIEDNLEIISEPDKLSTSHMKYFWLPQNISSLHRTQPHSRNLHHNPGVHNKTSFHYLADKFLASKRTKLFILFSKYSLLPDRSSVWMFETKSISSVSTFIMCQIRTLRVALTGSELLTLPPPGVAHVLETLILCLWTKIFTINISPACGVSWDISESWLRVIEIVIGSIIFQEFFIYLTFTEIKYNT